MGAIMSKKILFIIIFQSQLLSQVNFDPSVNLELVLRPYCTNLYNADCKNMLNGFKSGKTETFIKASAEYMQLIKKALDIGKRIAQLESSRLDITAVSTFRDPLQKYQLCLERLQKPIS